MHGDLLLQLFQMLLEKDEGGESVIVEVDKALPFFLATLKAADVDPASLTSISPTDLLSSYATDKEKAAALAAFGR